MQKAYVSPTLTKVGTVKDLTLGEGLRGSDDTFVFNWGPIHLEIPYGTGS